MHCFVADVECPNETLAWLAALGPYLTESEHHSYHSAMLGYRAALVSARIKQSLALKDGPHCSTVQSIIREVEQLEENIIADMSCTDVGAFINLTLVNMYNYHRAIRMKVRSNLGELLDKIAYSPEPQLDSLTREIQSSMCVEVISTLSDETLNTIPIVLDVNPPRTVAAPGQVGTSYLRPQKWHDAMSLLWPLRQVAWFALSSNDQKSAARAGLRRIASEFYLMHAISR